MLNYQNLSDYDFEILCKDIMSIRLKTELRSFGKGRDGGIDLCDNLYTRANVVQVKHYTGSSFSTLLSNLKKEVPKVKNLNPGQYYICCSQSLSPENVKSIYDLFKKYMRSEKNVITLVEIDQFLQEHPEVLRRHYKLWLDSTNILSQIYNRAIFIDCESLLADINEKSQLFVETQAYVDCIKMLKKNNILLILGAPGVGKTMTTKMLALYYARLGYSIRYTTDGQLFHLKNSLSENVKAQELVILDDCLGQTYYKMKDSQENELLSLINYVSVHKSKKLIMNSRITIFNEATDRSESFRDYITLNNQERVKIIDISKMEIREKGQILYNHLYFRGVPSGYYENILIDKGYRKIVTHKNYTPRIMEYFTTPGRLEAANIQPQEYITYCLNCLDHPNEIWKNEFDRRLAPIDRLLLTTLYSLTDVSVELDMLREVFLKRVMRIPNLDITRDVFELALVHLNNSMIKMMDIKGTCHVGVINPSVNDFLQTIVSPGTMEYMNILQNVLEYIQVQRLFKNEFVSMVYSGKAFDLHYPSEACRMAVILNAICLNNIMSENCKPIVNAFLTTFPNWTAADVAEPGKNMWSQNYKNLLLNFMVLCDLLKPEMDDYYKCKDILDKHPGSMQMLFKTMDIDDWSVLLDEIKNSVESYGEDWGWIITDNEQSFIDSINQAIQNYANEIDDSEYIEESDFWDIYDNYEDVDSKILDIVTEKVDEEIIEKLCLIPKKYDSRINWNPDYYNVDASSLYDYYLQQKWDDDDRYDDWRDNQSLDDGSDGLDDIFR